MRHARVLTGSILVGALLLAGCSSDGSKQGSSTESPSAAVTLPPQAGKVNFKDCTDNIKPQLQSQPGGERDLSFGCGTLQVPLDHDKPDGKQLRLYLVRIHLASQKDRIGSLLLNPGGPGGSGLDAAVGLSLQMPTEVLERFDLVGFDPRGVGVSEGIKCISDSEKDTYAAADPDARTPQEFAQQVKDVGQVTEECTTKYGDKLAHINTVETVRDMDLIRRGLGDQKLTYLGFSYGTLLGSVYAQLYPDRVRAMVLDGAVDPAQKTLDAGEAQAKSFESVFDQFAAFCTSKGKACPLGSDPRKFVTALMDKARANPIPSTKTGEERRATAGNVQLAVVSALYDRDEWKALADALALADKGDAKGVFSLGDIYNQRGDDGHYANILDANITVNCNDSNERFSEQEVQAKLADWRKKYPMFGAGQALGLLLCQEWQPDRHPIPTVEKATTAGTPILVVGTVHDPATPYTAAQALTSELGSATLLTWEGDGHTAYPKTPCITSAVGKYLVDLTMPTAGTRCPAQ